MNRTRIFVMLLASALCPCSWTQHPEEASQGVGKRVFRGTLPQALLLVDQTFHVSVLGEIVDPVPNISFKVGPGTTPNEALKEIVAQCPGYVLVRKHEAFIVAQNELFEDQANPMNQVLRDYLVPNNLRMFRLDFPNEIVKAQQGIHERGGVYSGPGLPESLSPSLKKELIHNQTAREILLHVAGEVGNLFSILILPSPHPVKQMLRNTSFLAWEIAGGPGLATYTTALKGHPDAGNEN